MGLAPGVVVLTDPFHTATPRQARRSFGLAALDGLLYACGGNNGDADLNSLEVYDPATNRWRTLPPMRYARMYCSVSVLDGKIYAVGGLDSATTLDVVEVYDPKLNLWMDTAPKLDRRVCGCGLAVMDCVVVGQSIAGMGGRRRAGQPEEAKDEAAGMGAAAGGGAGAGAGGAGVGMVGVVGNNNNAAAAAAGVAAAVAPVGPPAAVAAGAGAAAAGAAAMDVVGGGAGAGNVVLAHDNWDLAGGNQ